MKPADTITIETCERSQFMPGPWEVVKSNGRNKIISVNPNKNGMEITNHVWDENDANLMAASPYMLAALEQFVAEFDMSEALQTGTNKEGRAIEMARAALAKARGERV